MGPGRGGGRGGGGASNGNFQQDLHRMKQSMEDGQKARESKFMNEIKTLIAGSTSAPH